MFLKRRGFHKLLPEWDILLYNGKYDEHQFTITILKELSK